MYHLFIAYLEVDFTQVLVVLEIFALNHFLLMWPELPDEGISGIRG